VLLGVSSEDVDFEVVVVVEDFAAAVEQVAAKLPDFPSLVEACVPYSGQVVADSAAALGFAAVVEEAH
jgi:hypothetical protein